VYPRFTADHDTTAKEFTFAIYPDGGKIIPARAAANGEQDALDFILALARNPATARRLATRLYKFFVNETAEPDQALVTAMANSYLGNNYNIKAVLRTLVNSQQFRDPANFFQRYSWPAEFVVRAIKETGWNGLSVNTAITPLTNMGQQRTSRRTSTAGSWTGLDFDLVMLAHELRVDARREPAIQPSRVTRSRTARLPNACSNTRWRGSGRWALRRRRINSMSDICDRRRGPVRRAAAAACSRPDPADHRVRRIIQLRSRHEFFTTTIRQGRRHGVHVWFRGAAGAVRHRVRAGRAVAQPRGRIQRRQRFAEHGDPHRDPFYASRRPTLAIPAGNVLQLAPIPRASSSGCIRG
jgi:hypothetical protein